MQNMRTLNFIIVCCLLSMALSCARGPKEFAYTISAHDLYVRFDPDQHSLRASDTMALRFSKPCEELIFFLNINLDVTDVRTGSQSFDFDLQKDLCLSDILGEVTEKDMQDYRNAQLLRVKIPRTLKPSELTVEYNGVIYDTLRSAEFSEMTIANQTTGLIGREGIFLSEVSHWYPRLPDELSAFRLNTVTPVGLEVVSQGKMIERRLEDGTLFTIWEEAKPVDAIHVSAGSFEISCIDYNGIEVSTYFLPESRSLVSEYLQASAHYLKMYSELFGPYPYSKFAVVENFFLTGYGLTSFALLGSSVIRLPFITRTSLGHEICHNWWGKGVFVNMRQGNWCTGLTTYSADYYYRELESAEIAREYRYEILKDYNSYVSAEEDFPLYKFTGRTTTRSRVIGYEKSAMFFHQLRTMLGDSTFFHTLRQFYRDHLFRRASWDDLRESFEKQSNTDLNWFFDQWLLRSGAPRLSISEAFYEEQGGRTIVHIEIEQGDDPFRLLIPVVVKTSSEVVRKLVRVDDLIQTVSVNCSAKPLSVALDPDYDLFRHLAPQEVVPSLNSAFGDKECLVVLPSRTNAQMRRAYRELAKQLVSDSTAILEDTTASVKLVTSNSLFLLGGPNENVLFDWASAKMPEGVSCNAQGLFVGGRKFGGPGQAWVIVIVHPTDLIKVVCSIVGYCQEAVSPLGSTLQHYGRYGYLAFEYGENIAKAMWPVPRGAIVYPFE